MCGIYLQIQRESSNAFIEKSLQEFVKIKHRGPDNSQFTLSKIQLGATSCDAAYGFHRLKINDLSENANQPFRYHDGSFSMCNGEIYNFRQIKTLLPNELFNSDNDCEVVYPLYRLQGEEMLQTLNGMFALVIYSAKERALFIARDICGERPLYIGFDEQGLIISSELKACNYNNVMQFPPGHYCKISDLNEPLNFIPYYSYQAGKPTQLTFQEATNTLKQHLFSSIEKLLMSNRPVGALLSGGIDSSVIAAIAASVSKQKFHTFTIGLHRDQDDLKYARLLASHLKTEHHEIIVDIDEALAIVDDAVGIIETYNPVLIPNHILLYFLARYISTTTDVKVLLDGTGADEILGGYKFFTEAPSAQDFIAETVQQVKELHKTELMAERAISAYGLETRSPYLDKPLLTFLMELPTEYKLPCSEYTDYKIREKLLLRNALSDVLPPEILNRPKVPMPEGASLEFLSRFEKAIEARVTDEEFQQARQRFPLIHRTEVYYKKIFYQHFPWANQVACGVKHTPWRSHQPNSIMIETAEDVLM